MAFLQGIYRSGAYDSELRTSMASPHTNAELTILLRVFLRRVTKAATGGHIKDVDQVDFKLRDWSEVEYRNFCTRYQTQGQCFWNGKYWLQTPDTFAEFDCPASPKTPTHRPNVYCKFKLEMVNSEAKAHTTIDLVRLDRNTGTSSTFRSHSKLYDNFDLGTSTYANVTDDKGKVHTYHQKTIVHEIGHSLGLDHIGVLVGNVACKADNTNANECYGMGMTDANASNVMGYGMNLTAIDAKPWLSRIAEHTKTSETDWKVFMKNNRGLWPFPRLLKTIHAGAA